MIDIIPAIDLMDGKCVRLSKGNYLNKKVYADNPVEVAKSFEEHGIHRLHLVDLDGAKSQHIVNHKVLKDIATHTSLNIDFGGGIKTTKTWKSHLTTVHRWSQSVASQPLIRNYLSAGCNDSVRRVSSWQQMPKTVILLSMDGKKRATWNCFPT